MVVSANKKEAIYKDHNVAPRPNTTISSRSHSAPPPRVLSTVHPHKAFESMLPVCHLPIGPPTVSSGTLYSVHSKWNSTAK